jgi:hypothetical protein
VHISTTVSALLWEKASNVAEGMLSLTQKLWFTYLGIPMAHRDGGGDGYDVGPVS